MSSFAAQYEKITLACGGNLYLYRPEKPNGIAIVMCPGGGYDHLAINHEGHDMADWFISQGITYGVLQYRLPVEPCDTLPMIDAHNAVKYIHDNACKLKVNCGKIGIMGASAGGHLASHIANTDSTVAFQILLYPVISMCDDNIVHGGSRVNLLGHSPTEQLKRDFSSENLISHTTPQTFIVLSADDKDVAPANSLHYLEALLNFRISAELHVYPSGGHGWGFRDTFPYKSQWLDAMRQWLNTLNTSN